MYFYAKLFGLFDGGVRKVRLFKGSWLTFKRLLRCAPWGKGGFDPTPFNLRGKTKWYV